MSGSDPNSSILAIEITSEHGTMVCRLAGELDNSVAGQVLNAVGGALDDAEVDTVVVDLARLLFMDSRGLYEFADVHDWLLEHHVEMSLINATPQIRRVFDVTGEAHMLDDTVGAHHASCSGGESPGV